MARLEQPPRAVAGEEGAALLRLAQVVRGRHEAEVVELAAVALRKRAEGPRLLRLGPHGVEEARRALDARRVRPPRGRVAPRRPEPFLRAADKGVCFGVSPLAGAAAEALDDVVDVPAPPDHGAILGGRGVFQLRHRDHVRRTCRTLYHTGKGPVSEPHHRVLATKKTQQQEQ